MTKEQTIFRKALSMVGKTVELGIQSTGENLTVIIKNAMFDSMLVSVKDNNRVIAFSDIAYLNPIKA